MPGFDSAAKEKLARELKAEARRLGFDLCGLAEAKPLDDEARHLEQWLAEGRHAGMDWMANHFDLRTDPTKLVPGARTVVCLVHSYWQGTPADPAASGPAVGRVARYAWGDDYHEVLKGKLAELFDWLDRRAGGIAGRVFVDSGPVLEKAWAQRAGLGWAGKNANLLNPRLGSYFFLAEMIVDVPLPPDAPFAADHCGSCTRCIDACPTDAIYRPGAVDANRCISYWTIEHRGPTFPEDLARDFGGWVFGCDVCQEVCPWTKFSRPTSDARFLARDGIATTPLAEWAELDIEAFRERFRRNPVKRAKYDGLMRNVASALGRASDE